MRVTALRDGDSGLIGNILVRRRSWIHEKKQDRSNLWLHSVRRMKDTSKKISVNRKLQFMLVTCILDY